MRFSIVTPSFRSSAWLKLCVASVADQRVELEHIVQDAGSDDGTLEWASRDSRIKLFVEKDAGMYDAVNRGLRKAAGQILAYLNCDEQYLPGALESVWSLFEQYPEIDVVFGDIILVDRKGEYLAHRKVQVPLLYHTWTCHLGTLSCAMFFRRRVFFEQGLEFDPGLRDVGDGEWVVRLLRRGIPMRTLGQFTSVFAFTGENMSVGQNARRENRQLRESAPGWVQAARPLWVLHHRLRRFLGRAWSQQPFSYDLYTLDSPGQRQHRKAARPSSRWPHVPPSV